MHAMTIDYDHELRDNFMDRSSLSISVSNFIIVLCILSVTVGNCGSADN